MDKKLKLISISIFNFALVVITIIINFIAVTLPLNGKTTGQLSDKYANLFVPAGLTFSIWGIIYLLLLIYSIYHIIVSIIDYSKIEKYFQTFIAFSLTCIFNCAWIFAWHYEKIEISILIMIFLLITLLYILNFLKSKNKIEKNSIFSTIPIEVYSGWITIATIANFTVLLVYLKWNGFGISPDIWTIIMILAGTLISISVIITYNAFFYGFVIIWAFIGILIKRYNSTPIYQNIIITTWLAIIILLFTIISTFLFRINLINTKNNSI